jgi:hypothetical protein
MTDPKPAENPLSKKELRACKEQWLQTLRHFGIHRGISMLEEVEIAKAIQRHGYEMVELALFGARFEPRTPEFNPANYVGIGRVLTRDDEGRERVDRFANLGSQRRKTHVPTVQSVAPAEESRVDGAEAAAKIKEIREGLRK